MPIISPGIAATALIGFIRGIFQTSELLPLLQERGVHLSREHVHRLVTRTPQRIKIDILAALVAPPACRQ